MRNVERDVEVRQLEVPSSRRAWNDIFSLVKAVVHFAE